MDTAGPWAMGQCVRGFGLEVLEELSSWGTEGALTWCNSRGKSGRSWLHGNIPELFQNHPGCLVGSVRKREAQAGRCCWVGFRDSRGCRRSEHRADAVPRESGRRGRGLDGCRRKGILGEERQRKKGVGTSKHASYLLEGGGHGLSMSNGANGAGEMRLHQRDLSGIYPKAAYLEGENFEGTIIFFLCIW